MNITSIVNSVTDTLNSASVPANKLPALLLKCTSLDRPGLSAYKIASEIIQNNEKLGIPTGTNPDGSDNLVNAFVYNIVKTFVKALKNDAVVHNCTPALSQKIGAWGANAGGSVYCEGFNLTDSTSNGRIM